MEALAERHGLTVAGGDLSSGPGAGAGRHGRRPRVARPAGAAALGGPARRRPLRHRRARRLGGRPAAAGAAGAGRRRARRGRRAPAGGAPAARAAARGGPGAGARRGRGDDGRLRRHRPRRRPHGGRQRRCAPCSSSTPCRWPRASPRSRPRRAGTRAALAAGGGEDYELLAALAPADVGAARRAASCPLTSVGRLEEGPPGLVALDAGGAAVPLEAAGWEHDV